MGYRVGPIRLLGFDAKWTKTSNGSPIIVAKKKDSKHWWAVDSYMWARAKVVGFSAAFDECTLLGEFFSVPI